VFGCQRIDTATSNQRPEGVSDLNQNFVKANRKVLESEHHSVYVMASGHQEK